MSINDPQSAPEQPANAGCGAALGSLSMFVWAGELVPGGAKRLARLIKQHGGIPRHAWKCPVCGGPIQADDDGGVVKMQWRYVIGCKNEDCVSVCGPSVKSVIKMWIEECEANAAAKPPVEGPGETIQ